MNIHDLLKQDINNIINKNINKLQLLYIELFNSSHKQDIKSINNKINYIRNNEEIFDLICKTNDIDNIHDYKMLTDVDYKIKHMKINNICINCQSINILHDEQITCIDCGSVLGYQYVTSYSLNQNYNKYINNIYKRKTYIKTIIKQKLNDISNKIKEEIINETNNILFQFNKTNMNQRKSFFSYSYMFRYILNKLKLYEYIDRFKPLKTKSIMKSNDEFYNNLGKIT